jgi:pantetheine-phosphate adenylyltransferase
MGIVAVGGTFDEFHKGHRALLEKAFKVGEHVMVGLCTDDFVEQMEKPHTIAPFAVRLEELKSFLRKKRWFKRAEIIPLYDSYGPALTNSKIKILVVSEETEPIAHVINKKRKLSGLPLLKIYVIKMVMAEKSGPITTTRIRNLEIDREGRLMER